MKKRNLVVTLLTTVLATTTIFTGCGTKNEPVTLNEVADTMQQTDFNSGAIKMNTAYAIGYLKDEATQLVEFGMDMDMQWAKEPIAFSWKQNIDIDAGENDLGFLENLNNMDIEMYVTKEEDKYFLYQTFGGEKWNKLELKDVSDFTDKYSDLFKENSMVIDLKELDEEQLKEYCTNANASVDGKAAYEFTFTGTFDELKDVFKDIFGGVEEIAGWSMGDQEMVCTLYVDKETYFPISCTIALNKTEESETNSKIWVDKFEITIKYTDINEVEEVPVPEEVKEDAKEVDNITDNFLEDFEWNFGEDFDWDIDYDFNFDEQFDWDFDWIW